MKQLLQSARSEIMRLRRENEILAARSDVVEVFAVALGMRNRNQGMAIDVAWEIERAIENIEAAEVQPEAM